MCKADEEKKDEREIWKQMTPAAWSDSIGPNSIFCETYEVTRKQIECQVAHGGYDVVVEVGCGTGEIIGKLKLDSSVKAFGLDINPDFIQYCRETHGCVTNATFLVQDAVHLMDWWKKEGANYYSKPLVVCPNNTLNIMPESIRGTVVSQMLQLTGPQGRCLVTFWNGHFFSHALLNYYKPNQALCGSFEVARHVDWERRSLLTPSGYSTEWMDPQQVQSLMRKYDVDVPLILSGFSNNDNITTGIPDDDHIQSSGNHLAIMMWFSGKSSSRAKSYYDSDDAQRFYSSIWGKETVHIGRYDLLTTSDLEDLSKQEQISRAQKLHEEQFIQLIKSKCCFATKKIRIVDFGCGYGGLLRRLHEHGVVWSAVGCDISGKMCEQARKWNEEQGCAKDICILEESYLDMSVPDESADLVMSMDALLHVGPERQHRAVQEAARILRPGGWMIFTDIMEKEEVDATEMQPIYDRIHLSKLGTVSNYQDAMTAAGFTGFDFAPHSSNVSAHYGTIREVLLASGATLGISKDYCDKMESGLKTWRDLAPSNIEWGFVMAQKTQKA